MNKQAISSGTVHKLPLDLRSALAAGKAALAAWESLTPLARNEWICWVTFVKRAETRREHVLRTIEELKLGERRPCCWLGCTHRPDKLISPSVQAILDRRAMKSKKDMTSDVRKYNNSQNGENKNICQRLEQVISEELKQAESKVWHRHPVWFIDGNPIAGYAVLKNCVQLLFWSGQSFKTTGLKPEGSFKAAEMRYAGLKNLKITLLRAWLKEAKQVQWDYKNIVKRKGKLVRL